MQYMRYIKKNKHSELYLKKIVKICINKILYLKKAFYFCLSISRNVDRTKSATRQEVHRLHFSTTKRRKKNKKFNLPIEKRATARERKREFCCVLHGKDCAPSWNPGLGLGEVESVCLADWLNVFSIIDEKKRLDLTRL